LLTLDVHHQADHLLIRLDGELDLESSRMFRDRLNDLRARADRPTVIDLSSLRFIDSSGLAALVATLRLPREHRPRVVLAPSDGPVNRVLRTTRLDLLLEISPSLEAALASPLAVRSAA
jgi:anti-sigma B factor antagonist